MNKVQEIKAEIKRRMKECSPVQSSEGKYRIEAYKELLGFIDDIQEEPVSEDMEEAAFDYAEACKYDGGEKLLCVEHFKAGAQWQKERMMKDAVGGEVFMTIFGDATITVDNLNGDLAQGDKVKVIIIKEK